MITERKPAECWLTDMDGVLVHEGNALPGGSAYVIGEAGLTTVPAPARSSAWPCGS